MMFCERDISVSGSGAERFYQSDRFTSQQLSFKIHNLDDVERPCGNRGTRLSKNVPQFVHSVYSFTRQGKPRHMESYPSFSTITLCTIPFS